MYKRQDVIRSFNMADQLGSDETSFLPYGTNSYVIYQIYIDEQEKERQHMLKHDLFRSICLLYTSRCV